MTIDRETAAALSAQLLEAERTGEAIPPVVGVIPEGDIDSAYLVQSLSTETKLTDGRRIVGRKIGLTNPAVQKQLGVDQPDFGVLFDDMAFADGDKIPAGRVLQPKVEAEIAFVLDADLEGAGLTEADLIAAIGSVQASIEIVGSRIANWQIGIVDTVADNGSSAAFVLGGQVRAIRDVDLTGCQMTMTRRRATSSEVVSQGTGADCLGSPLIAARWLAAELARRGDALRAGDIILTGALGPMVEVVAGDRFEVEISGIGTVAAEFE